MTLISTERPAVAAGRDVRSAETAIEGKLPWRTLAREPLLHFTLLGGLIFGADAWLHPPAKDDHVIVVTKALQKALTDGYSEDHDKSPTPAELQSAIDSWVASEILYKEGKAAGVDRGDQTIRDRIAYKLQLLIFDQIKVERPTPDQLRAWFKDNHGRFDEPELVSFYLTPPTDAATAQAELKDIQSGKEDPSLRDKTRAILARPTNSVATSLGKPFRDGLVALPVNQWSVLQSNEGWHVVRLDTLHPGQPARLEDHADEAARIWHDDEVRKRAWEAVIRLKASYTVRVE